MRPSLAVTIAVMLGLLATTARAEDLLTKSLNDCIGADSWSGCLKREMLSYLDGQLGTTTEARSLDSLDEAVVARTFKYLKRFEYGVDIPFVDARFKYRPARSLADLDIEFKENELATSQARGLLKKKILLPFLLLLKLKLKALMPIFVAIIGLKALKALVLSKLALVLVVGFIAVQFFKKGGASPPLSMSMDPAPAPAYGVPSVSSTTSGYEPPNTWDASGPYSRVWTPSSGVDAQNLAYNYYSSSGSSNSYAPSSSSGSSSLSSASSSSGSSSLASNY